MCKYTNLKDTAGQSARPILTCVVWAGVVVGVLGIVVELLVVDGVLLLVVVSGPGPSDIFQLSSCP